MSSARAEIIIMKDKSLITFMFSIQLMFCISFASNQQFVTYHWTYRSKYSLFSLNIFFLYNFLHCFPSEHCVKMAKVAAETKAVTKNLKTVQITPPPAKVNDDRIPKPSSLLRPINTKHMVLMGSGPTNPTQRVLEALAKPTVGLYSEELYQVCINYFYNTVRDVLGMLVAVNLTKRVISLQILMEKVCWHNRKKISPINMQCWIHKIF